MKKNLKKKSTAIKKFIDKSIGEWKSIRSTHTLAFQEFENTTSNLIISYLDINNSEVVNIVKKFNFELKPEFAISISWVETTNWSDKEKNQNETILVFLPKDSTSGVILRNKGYSELIDCHSSYLLDSKDYLDIFTEYNTTISEEKVWFLSKNVRTRYSIIKNKNYNSIIQTSHSSEIRKIITSEVE